MLDLKLTWERDVEKQIRDCLNKSKRSSKSRPFMIAVSGIPGSGKSTSAKILEDNLSDIGCMLVPFDGYHYSLEELKNRPDSEEALYRRGAPDTFDSGALLRDLRRIRDGDEEIVHVPGFDHETGDPRADEHTFNRGEHRVVIVEGLYLMHTSDGWNEIYNYFDRRIFVDASIDTCMNRLKERNKCIPGYSVEEIVARVDAIDRKNALIVERTKSRADIIVKSATASC